MRSVLKLLNRIRRELLAEETVQKKLALRKGSCRKCGECCSNCKHLTKTKKCAVYKNRPWFCHKDFPIDRIDQVVYGVKNCGYSFR